MQWTESHQKWMNEHTYASQVANWTVNKGYKVMTSGYLLCTGCIEMFQIPNQPPEANWFWK